MPSIWWHSAAATLLRRVYGLDSMTGRELLHYHRRWGCACSGIAIVPNTGNSFSPACRALITMIILDEMFFFVSAYTGIHLTFLLLTAEFCIDECNAVSSKTVKPLQFSHCLSVVDQFFVQFLTFYRCIHSEHISNVLLT